MKIKFVSVMVIDQEAALHFYTEKLGFSKMADIPVGELRWLTVISSDGYEGVELVLEPMQFEPAKVYQKAIYEAGIPATAFTTDDIQAEYERLKQRGVLFHSEPQNNGGIITVVFKDTCGNLINLVQSLI